MYVRLLKVFRFSSSLFLCFFVFISACSAQDSTSKKIILYTPYTNISVSPGQTINYSVDIINNSNAVKNIGLSVSGLSHSWDYSLKSGGWNISRISVLPGKKENLSLQVIVPLKINRGTYQFYVNAKGFTRLPLTLMVAKKGTYQTTFSAQQSNLEGAANSTFTFNAKLNNQTADTALYALEAEAPPGWNVAFKASYKQVSSVNVNPNQTENITITINPSSETPAGTYKIPVLASTNNSSAGFELEVVVTGSYAMNLTTPNGLLSTGITAGSKKRVELALQNTGSAPLKNVTLNFKAPVNWDVTFDPQKVDLLPAGRVAQIFATIKADKDAIAGDYVTSLEAKTPATSSTADLRVSVRTPVLWEWIGILIICIALGSVYFLFRKYGRR